MMRLIKTLFVLFGLLNYPLTVLAQNMFKTVADTPVYAQILGENRQVAMLSPPPKAIPLLPKLSPFSSVMKRRTLKKIPFDKGIRRKVRWKKIKI